MESKTKSRLRKKLDKKKKPDESTSEDQSIFDMLNQVNKILKQNPEMISKVNKCVSSVIGNQDLMTKLTEEIQNNIGKQPYSDSDSDSEPCSSSCPEGPGQSPGISIEVTCPDITNLHISGSNSDPILDPGQILENKDLSESAEAESNESTQ